MSVRFPLAKTESRREVPQKPGIAFHFLRRPRERQIEVLLHDHDADARGQLLLGG